MIPLSLRIGEDDPGARDVVVLLRQHLAFTRAQSPPESCHALAPSDLAVPDVTFWSVRDDAGALLGCGALKRLDARHVELKSMCTASQARGRGVGAALLAHLLEQARRRGFARMSLETGSMAAFAPACRLYARFGFHDCAPFAGYVEDPHSRFMSRAL